MTELLIFNKWPTSGITVNDPGLERYITTSAVLVPKTGARYAGQKFYKSKITLVERLINRLMVPGHKAKKHKISSGSTTGKGVTVYNIVFDTLQIIEKKTKKNPIEVLVKAVENAAPREEIITIEYGGARYPKAVECSPQRRIDQVLKLLVQSTYQKSFKSKKGTAAILADEIIAAYNMSAQSVVISKKLELERQADASR
jgi:small subunit ribosomal protein S7